MIRRLLYHLSILKLYLESCDIVLDIEQLLYWKCNRNTKLRVYSIQMNYNWLKIQNIISLTFDSALLLENK